ncbi:unnamed protein product [Linum trigynum]|uniref:Leucine-rich repeat-containing N-terminal plant-type domain-containing protein n=2 Tax=Linum trigynum TaxID=586398 RepID=A0AAV2CRU6_9ROSI
MARRIPIWVLLISVTFMIISSTSEESPEVTQSLVRFMETLSERNPPPIQNWGWSPGSDPCTWTGVFCHPETRSVTGIILNGYNFSGRFDPTSLCHLAPPPSLYVLDLRNNGIFGLLPPEIGECRSLTDLYLAGNRFTGRVPSSINMLGNLGRVDISGNSFAGRIPTELTWISGLVSFKAQNNRFTGEIPVFDVNKLLEFDVSNNDFVGRIPDAYGGFPESCFQGNAGLCGHPLPIACPPAPA